MSRYVTSLLKTLQWFPLSLMIISKILTTTYKLYLVCPPAPRSTSSLMPFSSFGHCDWPKIPWLLRLYQVISHFRVYVFAVPFAWIILTLEICMAWYITSFESLLKCYPLRGPLRLLFVKGHTPLRWPSEPNHHYSFSCYCPYHQVAWFTFFIIPISLLDVNSIMAA